MNHKSISIFTQVPPSINIYDYISFMIICRSSESLDSVIYNGMELVLLTFEPLLITMPIWTQDSLSILKGIDIYSLPVFWHKLCLWQLFYLCKYLMLILTAMHILMDEFLCNQINILHVIMVEEKISNFCFFKYLFWWHQIAFSYKKFL